MYFYKLSTQTKEGQTRMLGSPEKKGAKWSLFGRGSLSYFLEIQRYYWSWRRKEKVGNELCLLQPLLLPLPLIENYIFLHNWETHFHTIEKMCFCAVKKNISSHIDISISTQLRNSFPYICEIHCCTMKKYISLQKKYILINIFLHNWKMYNVEQILKYIS